MADGRYQAIKKKISIHAFITISFTIIMVAGMSFLGMILYWFFYSHMEDIAEFTTSQLQQQAAGNLDNYFNSAIEIGRAVNTVSAQNGSANAVKLKETMQILYSAEENRITSMFCFDRDGRLMVAVPENSLRENLEIYEEDWYRQAMLNDNKSVRISKPHVQRMYENSSYKYNWVVSLSENINVYNGASIASCVLVIDIDYNSIAELLQELNVDTSSSYTYLMEEDGTIIYHPMANLISSGLYNENSIETAEHEDGTWKQKFNGSRIIAMRTLPSTGWKIVTVVRGESLAVSLQDTKYFVVIVVLLAIITLVLVIPIISTMITKPIDRLTQSIQDISSDGLPKDIYVDGSYEVVYLGSAIRDFVVRLRQLMKDIVKEQEEKRRSELDALQAQINPHFLYNALDSLVWMIEGDRQHDAIFMVKQLASLFRISLSKGKTMISIEDEIKHAQNYMNIQSIRLAGKFEVEYDIDPQILGGTIVKLVLQPLLENALYYAVEDMDGDGEILVKGYIENGDVYIQVIDNGMGMPQETVDNLLIEGNRVHKHGSGVGVMNVHKRLQIRFGEEYGLLITSEPDEGTTVTIHIPFRPYEQEVGQ